MSEDTEIKDQVRRLRLKDFPKEMRRAREIIAIGAPLASARVAELARGVKPAKARVPA